MPNQKQCGGVLGIPEDRGLEQGPLELHTPCLSSTFSGSLDPVFLSRPLWGWGTQVGAAGKVTHGTELWVSRGGRQPHSRDPNRIALCGP